MKYLVLFALLAVVYLLWKHQRTQERGGREGGTRPPPAGAARQAASPQEMVRCPVCALHLPHTDAVAGRTGQYCSEAHRQQAEG